jgi:hypothetical protein
MRWKVVGDWSWCILSYYHDIRLVDVRKTTQTSVRIADVRAGI